MAAAVAVEEGVGKMKTRSKIGNKNGNPAYRTAAVFRYNKHLSIGAIKAKGFRDKNNNPPRPDAGAGYESTNN